MGNLRKCHLTNVLYENVTFMRPWTDSSTWEDSVRHLEESMNEELTCVLSNVEESIPDASHASPDASHALPDASHASGRIPCGGVRPRTHERDIFVKNVVQMTFS
ncbi:hypothetical protein Hanom_Chr14g01267541 [Helianthus anomalus]